MYNNVPPQLWMQLEKAIRSHLVSVFNIPRTGITEVRDDTVIADGYSVEDLKAISLAKMTEYIGSEETFPRAWEITCSKAKGEVYPPINIPAPIQMADEPKEEPIIETNTKTHGTKKSK